MNEALSTRRLVRRLVFVVIAMFGFGFLLVPIYDVMCQAFGINGKTAGAYTGVQSADEARAVRVQFLATNAAGMRWEFGPLADQLSVHPGASQEIRFVAYNPTDKPMTAQAIPSVSPSRAAAYFHKTECFCFTLQTLQAGETRDMPVRFIIDPALPADVNTVTLSYMFYKNDLATERLSQAPRAGALSTARATR